MNAAKARSVSVAMLIFVYRHSLRMALLNDVKRPVTRERVCDRARDRANAIARAEGEGFV